MSEPNNKPPETPKSPVPTTPASAKSAINEDLVIGGTYSTKNFEQTKIPFCSECGDSYHSDIYGNPVCAEPHRKKCPRVE